MIVKITSSGNFMLFKHMNQMIVDEYKRQGIIPNIVEHRATFEQTHRVKVVVKNSCWRALEFASEQDYLMAILRWR